MTGTLAEALVDAAVGDALEFHTYSAQVEDVGYGAAEEEAASADVDAAINRTIEYLNTIKGFFFVCL